MSVAVVTGSGGLIGSEAAAHFAGLGYDVIGVDNDMRREFFGPDSSTAWNVQRLQDRFPRSYKHRDLDVRDRQEITRLFAELASEVSLVVHAAAQPSHDWAAREPFTDFDINAVGTLNMLEAVRQHAPGATFIFTSTNKVYGDRPNTLPLIELERRFDLPSEHAYANGIAEDMAVDSTLHSVFGASKLAADVLVQEYGRYFGLNTVCFRGGTLTGPQHAAAELHGFLAYLMACVMTGRAYTVIGYGGKQVRDVIHSEDVVAAFDRFHRDPRPGAVYNIGGGRRSNCSVLEAIDICENAAGRPLEWTYQDRARVGDHIWWVGSNERFEADYPGWSVTRGVEDIAAEMVEVNRARWSRDGGT